MRLKILILAGYIALLLAVTLVVYRGSPYAPIELDPIASYRRAANAPAPLARIEIRNAVLNVLMFIPMGFLPPLVWRVMAKPYILIPAALALTLTIETAQLLTNRGVFAIEDILHNVIGAAIGLLGYKIWISITSK